MQKKKNYKSSYKIFLTGHINIKVDIIRGGHLDQIDPTK